jgi:hypothetical protein
MQLLVQLRVAATLYQNWDLRQNTKLPLVDHVEAYQRILLWLHFV